MKVFSFILLFVSFSLLAEETNMPYEVKQNDTIFNHTDENGMKQGKWIYLGKHQPEKGFPDDGKIAEGPFIDDRKEGHWIMYYIDGVTRKTEGEFSNNRPDGAFIKYHPNGKVKEKGTFKKRNYSDSLLRYNENGDLIYACLLDESGREAGDVKFYYDNGQLEFSYKAESGKPTGEAIRYWANGDIKEKILFGEGGVIEETSGEIPMVNKEVKVKSAKKVEVKYPPKPSSTPEFKPNGYNKIFNSDRELWMEGDFKNGLLFDGRLYIYDEDGLLYKVEVYKEGTYHSDGQL